MVSATFGSFRFCATIFSCNCSASAKFIRPSQHVTIGGTRREQNRGLVTLHVDDGFERAAIRLMLANQLRQPITNRDQTSGRLQGSGVMNGAKEKGARFSTLAVNNCHSAVTQRSINRQDTHGSMLNKTEREENAANNTDNHTYQPVTSAFR